MIDSVKKAFALGVKALKLFYVLAAVNIVINLINFLIIPAPVNVEMTLGRSFAVIGLTILSVLVGVFVYGGALAYVRELIKAGAADVASFVDNGKKYFLRLLAVSVVVLLAFLILGIVSSIIVGILPNVLRPLMIIIIAPAFIALTVLLIMSGYALVGSDLGVIESIKKAILVGKENFLKILGILAIMFLIGVAVMVTASLVSGILSFILRPISGLITAIIMAVANAVLTVLVSIAYMDFYLKNVSVESAQS